MATGFELPGMVELSAEAHAAGEASGLRQWRATFAFGVTVMVWGASLAEALELAGDECLLLEDLEASEEPEAPALLEVLADELEPGDVFGDGLTVLELRGCYLLPFQPASSRAVFVEDAIGSRREVMLKRDVPIPVDRAAA